MKALLLLLFAPALLAQQINTGNYRKTSAPPVSAWPMNEGSGLTLHDTSGNSNTATISSAGAVTWQTNTGLPGTTPLWGGAGYAPATNAALTSFDGTKPFTACTWIRASSLAATDQFFLSNIDASTPALNGFIFEIQSTGDLRTYLVSNISTNNYIDVKSPNGAIAANTTYQTCFTYDGSKTAAGMKLYINAVSQTLTVTKDALTGSSASTTPVSLGGAKNGATYVNPLSGAMAFTEIWGYLFTQAQISANYAKGPGIY